MADIIQQRRDTAARWKQYNPILLEGEVGYVTDNPNQYKIGDGKTPWNSLPLRGYTGTITQDTGSDENAVMSQKAVTEKLSEFGQDLYDSLRFNERVISSTVSNTANYAQWDIKKGDKYIVKVFSAAIGSEVAVGTSLKEETAGFEQLLFSRTDSDSYEVFAEITSNANFFKLYSANNGTKFEVYKIGDKSRIANIEERIADEEKKILNLEGETYSNSEIISLNVSKRADYIEWNIKRGDKYIVQVSNAVVGSAVAVGVTLGREVPGFEQKFFEGSENDSYKIIAEITSDANFFKLYSASENTKFEVYKIEGVSKVSGLETYMSKVEKKVDVLNDITHINTDAISVKVSNDSNYIPWDIKKGERYFFRIDNAVIGSNVAVGTSTENYMVGFTEKFFEGNDSDSYELCIDINIDAAFFKLYSGSTDTRFVVRKEGYPIKNEVLSLNSNKLVLFRSLTNDKADTTLFPIRVGERLKFVIKGLSEGSNIAIGAVKNSTDVGFAQRFFYAENVSENIIEVDAIVEKDLDYLKLYAKSENAEIEVYKTTSINETINELKKGSVVFTGYVVTNATIHTNNSYFEYAIHPEEEFYIKLQNIPIGSDVHVGTNNGLSAGFVDNFVVINNSEVESYEIRVKATASAEYFKCWANSEGVLVSIYNNKKTLQQYVESAPEGKSTGDSTGYTTLGKETEGGENNYCVAIGSRALQNNKGIKNIAIGNDNMYSSTAKSHDNTAVGYHASFRNTDGYYNAAFGSESQDDNTTGINNTSIGFCSLQRNNIGNDNVAVGYFAIDGIYDNRFDAENPKSYNRNVAVGSRAMIDAEVNSDDNVAVGYNTLGTKKRYKKCIAIGNNVDCTKDNQMVLGSSEITEMIVMGNKKIIFNADGRVTWGNV